MSTWPDSATIQRERDEADEAQERSVIQIERFLPPDERPLDLVDIETDALVCTLYWSLWGAMQRHGITDHERYKGHPEHEWETCWRCHGVSAMREVEERSRLKLQGLKELGVGG